MASGKLLLRMSTELHESLQLEAATSGRSINDICHQRIIASSALQNFPEYLGDAILAAKAVAGKALVGIAVFGSFARGTNNDNSDLDLLIVLNSKKPITRILYHSWQKQIGDGPTCEPHFVQLPDSIDYVSGFWAEVAIDSVILLDEELKLNRYLSQVRRLLLSGRMTQKKSHGQAYWIHNEVA